MRFRSMLFGLVSALLCLVGDSFAGTSLFTVFYEQRELVAAILFEQNSCEFDNIAAAGIELALARIRDIDDNERLIRIEGFPGRSGIPEENFRLSLQRANAVATYLEQKGIACQVGISKDGARRVGAKNSDEVAYVEIASYPKMLLLDEDLSVRVDLDEVK